MKKIFMSFIMMTLILLFSVSGSFAANTISATAYKAGDVVEVKGKAPSNHIPGFGCGQDTLTKLSEQVGLWKNLLGSERGRRDLSTILGGQIPLAELKKCKLRVVGLTGTRKGKGIKILTDYELVN